jgi:phenylacetate-CoA ligase
MKKADGKDYLTITVEREDGGDPSRYQVLSKQVDRKLKKQVMVNGRGQICDYGTSPRTERKSKRVFDKRKE